MKYLAFILLTIGAPRAFAQTTHQVTVHINQPLTCEVISAAAEHIEHPEVHPNPASSTLFIRGVMEGSSLEIRDSYSRQVYQRVHVTHDNHAIDVMGFARGIYVIITRRGENVYTTRIILK